MPTYDYECTECDHTFEEFHEMNKNITKCTMCGANIVRLIGGGGGIIFKGAGFHKTDYRTQKYIEDKQYDNRQARKAKRLASR
jgi:putative FmdB family regulatory protein